MPTVTFKGMAELSMLTIANAKLPLGDVNGLDQMSMLPSWIKV